VTNTFVGAGFVLANAGQQSAKGLEFDMIYRPVENLSLAFSGLLIDSVYDSFVGAAGGDKSGDDVEGVHPESLSASATWNWSANAYDGFARIHYQ
jgi:outer membrane receptor protein involved in Fe transport